MGKFKQFLLESADNDHYIELAMDVDSNLKELNEMVREQAIEKGYNVIGFHGKSGDIPNIFKPTKDGYNSSWESRPAIYFATQRHSSEMFADSASRRTGEESQILKAYLKVGESVEKFSTDESVAELKERGIDSTILRDVESKELVEYALFDPNQIKSADPVTYDDNGNLILLSKRFDESSDDIRY